MSISEQLEAARQASVRQAEETVLTGRYQYAWEQLYSATGETIPEIKAMEARLERLAAAWMEHLCVHGPGDIQGRALSVAAQEEKD